MRGRRGTRISDYHAIATEAERSFREVYTTLKQIARRERRRMPDRLLDTTSLVHEAWLKLERSRSGFSDQRHYVSTAALAMRQILTDFARYRMVRREESSAFASVPLATEFRRQENECNNPPDSVSELDILAMDEALTRLATIDPRLVEIVHLRFYAGLTLEELAEHQGICVRTASRHWRRAKSLLRVLLKGGPE